MVQTPLGYHFFQVQEFSSKFQATLKFIKNILFTLDILFWLILEDFLGCSLGYLFSAFTLWLTLFWRFGVKLERTGKIKKKKLFKIKNSKVSKAFGLVLNKIQKIIACLSFPAGLTTWLLSLECQINYVCVCIHFRILVD